MEQFTEKDFEKMIKGERSDKFEHPIITPDTPRPQLVYPVITPDTPPAEVQKVRRKKK